MRSMVILLRLRFLRRLTDLWRRKWLVFAFAVLSTFVAPFISMSLHRHSIIVQEDSGNDGGFIDDRRSRKTGEFNVQRLDARAAGLREQERHARNGALALIAFARGEAGHEADFAYALPFERKLISEKVEFDDFPIGSKLAGAALSSRLAFDEIADQVRSDPEADALTLTLRMWVEHTMASHGIRGRLNKFSCGLLVCIGEFAGGDKNQYSDFDNAISMNPPSIVGGVQTAMEFSGQHGLVFRFALTIMD